MSSIPISPIPSVNKEVASKFHSLRWKFLLANVSIAILISFSCLLLLWLGLATMDYFLEIQVGWLQLAMACGIGAVACGALVSMLRNRKHSRAREFVSLLERTFESFGQRIRTVLDTADGKVSGPPEMIAALGHQTLGRWETLAPTQIVPKKALAVSISIAVATLAVALLSLMGQSEWRTAMLRSVGYHIPYTSLSVKPGNFRVLEGKDVEVSLELVGRQNRDVQLRYKAVNVADESAEVVPSSDGRNDQSDWIVSDLSKRDGGDFGFEFGQAKSPIDYQFVTSAGSTDVYRIDVQPLIVAVRTEINTVPPSYTGLEPRTFLGSDATVLERSKVTVRVESNHPLATVQLEIGERLSKLVEAPAVIGPSGDEVLFELPTTESLHWKLNATGKDGTPMTMLKGRLRVREDAAPSIRWQDPQDEIRVHTLAELPMRAQVSDDYGVIETGIMFRIGDDEEFELTKKSIDELTSSSNAITTSMLLDEVLPLESFSLTERDYISYYAFAIDNRDWGQQRVETDVRYIDIRPLRQFFQEMELDPNQNGGNRVIVQLDEIIRRQRHLISRTRKMEKSGDSKTTDNLKVIDRMVQAESELAGLTRFLAEFFLSRGNDDVEALSQAEASMLQAADSLSAANVPLALTQEEDALRGLVEARRQLEVLLPKSTMAQQQQMSQLARQLQQKLRREVIQTEQQIADTLERIANEQMQLSEQMTNASHGSSSQNNSGTLGQGSPDSPAREIGESNELVLKDQREGLFGRQVELLERVQSIEEQLSSRLEKSKLMSERMREVKSDMDILSKMARAGEEETFRERSQEVSDLLRELSTQLAALSATEAVNRVASMRDMTLSMAERERDLVDAMQQASNATSSSNAANAEISGSGPASESNDANTTTANRARAARRLERRAETIADVLASPTEVGDVAMSEVQDAIDNFVASNQFTDKLNQSQTAAVKASQGIADNGESNANENRDKSNGLTPEVDQGLERARDYADSAGQLELLYRQLVSPRLARLRQIEQQATNLNKELASQIGKSGSSMTTQSKVGQLQRDLKQEGMSDLADLLDPSREEPQTGSSGPEQAKSGSAQSSSGEFGSARYGIGPPTSVTNRVEVVVKELREQIQELILLEVAADRETPIPAVYRSAVDGYFRAIAGEGEKE